MVAAIRNGSKTSTTSTVIEYSVESEALPQVGQRQIVVDSDGKPAAVIEIAAVTHARLSDIDLQHARDEGEGFESVDEWRRAHEEFWHGDAMRAYLDDPQFTVNDSTELVLERFHLVQLLP
ncbi:MAG TPA: ASCH domain-containing protein [Aeromicrobium sp.]|nr:ASCH domain-containing protein [Aeromicrobium sp.]